MLVYFYHFQKWVGSVFSDHLYNFQSKGAKRHGSLMLSVWGDIAGKRLRGRADPRKHLR